ncbi:MAG: patatin-like phospholipase family protein [Filifactoraceae bacterium]
MKGLVLEGGGLRGIFTAGVLDYFAEKDIKFDYIIGVSAGACNGASFVSKQKGRNKRISDNYSQDPRYVGIGNMIKTKSMFGMDFIFNEIPNKLDTFDYKTFYENPVIFCVGATNVITGLPEYFYKEKDWDIATVFKASSSIPIFSPVVNYRGKKYLDGGTSDPIPVKKAIEDGCDDLTIVLTQNRNYRKEPESMKRIYTRIFKNYPGMIRCLNRRYAVYNGTLDFIRELEKENKAKIIAPIKPVKVGRFDRNQEELTKLYEEGYLMAKQVWRNF